MAPPFPYFGAPLDTCVEYAGSGTCVHCGLHVAERLNLDELVYDCPSCRRPFAVEADGEPDEGIACPHCGARDHVRELGPEPAICIPCLRAGRGAFTRDTEYGMVRWEDAMRGRTHGLPGRPRADPGFALAEPSEDGWVAVVVPAAILLELVRTPSYQTWQGERWLFCCSNAMTFIGEWTRGDLDRHAKGAPQEAFAAIFGEEPQLLEHLQTVPSSDGLCAYVFRCASCGRHRGHLDAS